MRAYRAHAKKKYNMAIIFSKNKNIECTSHAPCHLFRIIMNYEAECKAEQIVVRGSQGLLLYVCGIKAERNQ